MKPSNIKYTIITFFSVLLCFACEHKNNANFSIEGELANLNIDKIIAVQEITEDSLIIDTIKVNKNGEFKYEGILKHPSLMSLFCGENTQPLKFYLGIDYHIKIKGDIEQADLVEIKGGNVNDDLQKFRNNNSNLLQSRYRILNKKENFDPSELKNINLQLAKNAQDYAEKNTSKIASVILLNEYAVEYTSIDIFYKHINALNGSVTDFFLTNSLKKYCEKVKSSTEGSVAPYFMLKDTKGKMISPLNEYKNKNILLIFDTKESYSNKGYTNSLIDIQKKLKGKINFISILIDANDNPVDSLTTAISKNLDWKVLISNNRWGANEIKKYNIKTVPYMLLISSDGKIEKRNVSLDSLAAQFSEKKTLSLGK